eukprot:gene54326-72592_t
MQNLDQLRAAHALKWVNDCNANLKEPTLVRRDAAKLPALLLSNGLLAAFAFAGMASAALAAPSVIKVTLFDLGSGATMATDMGMTMGGDKSKAVMKIAATPAFAKAGDVTFEVTNNSKDVIHEMIVVKLKDEKTPLPYVAADNKVDEDAAGHLGEVSELDPGKGGALTLKLDP